MSEEAPVGASNMTVNNDGSMVKPMNEEHSSRKTVDCKIYNMAKI